jgi:hypothetical protein
MTDDLIRDLLREYASYEPPPYEERVEPIPGRKGWHRWTLLVRGEVVRQGVAPTRSDAMRHCALAYRRWADAGDTEVIDLDNPPA